MSAARDHLHQLIEGLPDAELDAAQRFLEFLSLEPIGPSFAKSIRRGVAQADAGQTTVCDSYDDMAAKILSER